MLSETTSMLSGMLMCCEAVLCLLVTYVACIWTFEKYFKNKPSTKIGNNV